MIGDNKLVSILIVTYNAERYIKNTLLSCVSQTYNNIEILILDNNSSDNTIRIIRSVKNNKVKLFKNAENVGPYKGLNFLLRVANGEYIAIQDHDDIWFPEKIEKQVDFLEKNPNFIACGTDVYYFFESENLFSLKKFKKIEEYVNHTSLIFRNNNFRYTVNIPMPDVYFEKKILSKKGMIGCIQEGLTIHRIRDDGRNLSMKSKIKINEVKFFFRVNRVSLNTIMFFVYLVFRQFIPKKMIWFIRKNLTMRKRSWMTKNDFMQKFTQISI